MNLITSIFNYLSAGLSALTKSYYAYYTESDRIGDSVRTDSIVKQHQLTAFNDDADTISTSVTGYGNTRLNDLSVYEMATISDWLARPVNIDTVTWQPTATPGKKLGYYSFPHVLSQIPAFSDKIKNFEFLRADVKMSFRVNATAFHYGTVVASGCPMMSTLDDSYFNLTSMQAMPSVRISPNTTEVAELSFPYALSNPYVRLDEETGTHEHSEFLGVYLYVLNSLTTTTGTAPNVEISVWASLHNVSLTGYTNDTVVNVPQPADPPELDGTYSISNLGITRIRSIPFSTTDSLPMYLPRYNVDSTVSDYVTETGVHKEQDDKSKDQSASSSLMAPVNAVLDTARVLSDTIGSFIPFFSLFSKPTSTHVSQNVDVVMPTLSHGVGLDTGQLLSNDPENCVGSLSGIAGFSDDNFSIEKYIATPGFIGTALLESSWGVNKPFFQCACTPHQSLQRISNNDVQVFHTPLSYVASMFDFWRTDFVFKLHVSCSNFHSFRLRASWVPDNEVLPVPDLAYQVNASNIVSQIFDINGTTNCEFVVPYLSDRLYCNSTGRIEAILGPNASIISNICGHLQLSLVTPVVSNVASPNVVFVNVYISGKNAQFAKPTTFRIGYSNLKTLTNEEYFTEGLLDDDSDSAPAKSLDQDARVAMPQNFCFGETIENFKQLIAIPGISCILGDKWDGFWVVAPLSYDTLNRGDGNHLVYISRMFRFWRGSVRMTGYPGNLTSNGMTYNVVIVPPKPTASAANPYGVFSTKKFNRLMASAGTSFGLQMQCPQGMMNATIPYYFPYMCVPTGRYWDKSYTPCLAIKPFDNTVRLLQSAGDDFQLGFPIGPPSVLSNLRNRYIGTTFQSYLNPDREPLGAMWEH